MGDKVWRDTGVLLEGPDIDFLVQAFMQVWGKSRAGIILNRASFQLRRSGPLQTGLLRLNSRIRWRFRLLRDLKKRVRQAQTRILITNAYFLPRKAVLSSIRKAARKGIYVGICIPAKSDVWFVKLATKSLYFRLIKSGVHVFEYQPRVLHAKTLIIDSWATVGSHNLNHRSLNHDLEAEAIITNKENIDSLIAAWDHDIANSKAITLSDLGKMGIIESLVSKVIYWFRYWI
jgi:cardiolipin synthase